MNEEEANQTNRKEIDINLSNKIEAYQENNEGMLL